MITWFLKHIVLDLKILQRDDIRPPKPKAKFGDYVIWSEDQWLQVCNTCGGNCGQCGTSRNMGMSPSMDVTILRLKLNKFGPNL